MSEFTDTIRTVFFNNDEVRDRGLTTPEDIYRYDDMVYGEDENIQVLDLYCLKEDKDRFVPTIINVHGGGWVYGDKERYQYYCMDLARRGFKVVNFTYHLAPEYKFPTALIDTNMVLSWVKENSEKYKLDLNHLFGIGDSAGANQLGIIAGIVSKPSLGEKLGIIPPEGIEFKAIALNHGCYDMQTPTGVGDMESMNDSIMKELFENHGTPEELALMSVPNYLNPNYPPVYMVSSTDDMLRYEPLPMIKALTENSLNFVYHFFGSPERKLPHVFHLDIRNKDAKIVNDEECDYFKSFC